MFSKFLLKAIKVHLILHQAWYGHSMEYGPSITSLTKYNSNIHGPTIFHPDAGRAIHLEDYPNYSVVVPLAHENATATSNQVFIARHLSGPGAFQVVAPDGHGVMALIQSLDLRTAPTGCNDFIQFGEDATETSGTCGKVDIRDGSSSPASLLGPRFFISPSGTMKVLFYHGFIWGLVRDFNFDLLDPSRNPLLKVEIVFTAYKECEPAPTLLPAAYRSCTSSTFKTCIPTPLFCDNTLHCASDESFGADEIITNCLPNFINLLLPSFSKESLYSNLEHVIELQDVLDARSNTLTTSATTVSSKPTIISTIRTSTTLKSTPITIFTTPVTTIKPNTTTSTPPIALENSPSTQLAPITKTKLSFFSTTSSISRIPLRKISATSTEVTPTATFDISTTTTLLPIPTMNPTANYRSQRQHLKPSQSIPIQASHFTNFPNEFKESTQRKITLLYPRKEANNMESAIHQSSVANPNPTEFETNLSSVPPEETIRINMTYVGNKNPALSMEEDEVVQLHGMDGIMHNDSHSTQEVSMNDTIRATIDIESASKQLSMILWIALAILIGIAASLLFRIYCWKNRVVWIPNPKALRVRRKKRVIYNIANPSRNHNSNRDAINREVSSLKNTRKETPPSYEILFPKSSLHDADVLP